MDSSDPIERARSNITVLLGVIDDALDRGADEYTLRRYSLLLKSQRARLARFEAYEAAAQTQRGIA